MKTIWDRIHVWLAANAPKVLKSLRPGASEDAIAAAEREMGVTFPEDVKACYRIHDGQRKLKGRHWPPDFLDGAEWHSLDSMLREWRSMMSLVNDGTFAQWRSKPDGPIKTEWWHPAWIPLTSNHSGQLDCLDLAPEPGGQIGQIICWWHDDAARDLGADSFTEWLEMFADDLDDGEWTTDPRYHGLVSIHDI
jgi:cell wall assembly regulator SMI1